MGTAVHVHKTLPPWILPENAAVQAGKVTGAVAFGVGHTCIPTAFETPFQQGLTLSSHFLPPDLWLPPIVPSRWVTY